LGEILTRIPGASDFFEGSVVAYSNDVKVKVLGVSRSLLKSHGAVSAEVAREMASGARVVLGSDYGLGITGLAGPSGATRAKPLGTVHIALAGPSAQLISQDYRFPGDRQVVRLRSVYAALDLLRRNL